MLEPVGAKIYLFILCLCVCRHANDHLDDEELSRDLELAHEIVFESMNSSSFPVLSFRFRRTFSVFSRKTDRSMNFVVL